MRILTLRCGVGDMPLLPGRRDLAFLDDVAKQVLPHDDNPTPDEIAKGKEVPHLGAPQLAPQRPSEPVRVIVPAASTTSPARIAALNCTSE